MWLNFSKIEILVLERLSEGSAGPGKLAGALGKKNSFISRVIGKLLQKGMITKNGHEILLSQAAHAQSFKRLYDSRPNARIEDWLCGSAMDVMIVLAGFASGTDIKTLAQEVACSKPTVFGVLKALYSAGVAGKRGNTIWICDSFVCEFAQTYADGICQLLVSKANGHNISTRVIKNVVVRTDAKDVPPLFSQTGMNVLIARGMDAIKTSYDDYSFSLDMKKRAVGVEEAFIDALLLTTLLLHQDNVVLAIFLKKNRKRLNIGKLRELAKRYNVAGELDAMRQALDYAEKVG